MILSLLLCLAAQARTIGVIIGAQEFWRQECPRTDTSAACLDERQRLRYADDDAWRAAYFMQTLMPSENIRVLTAPDDSTRTRSFPGGDPGAPTAANLLLTLRKLRGDPKGGPQTVVLFIAAHGSPLEVHLADGRHDFQQLRADLLDVLGPQDDLVLIADACNSARWRSGGYGVKPMLYFPPVQVSQGRLIEAVVDGITPEDDEILGGVFTYLTLSAWMGAGDVDEDGELSAQELQDLLFRYAEAGTRAPFAPVVRSPKGSSNHPLPESLFGGTIVVGSDVPTRWLLLVTGGELGSPGVALGEAFTEARGKARLRVPPGTYMVVELPCTWDRTRRTYSALGTEAIVYEVVVRAEESSELEGPGQRVPLGTRGGRGELGTTIDNLPVAALEALPPDRARYHGAKRVWTGLGLVVSSPALVSARRDALLLGPGAHLRHPLYGGRLQLTEDLAWMAEVGGAEASELQFASLGTSLTLLVYSRPHFYIGPHAGAQVDLGRLTTQMGDQSLSYGYTALGPRAGVSATLVDRRSAWRLSVEWDPRWVRADDERLAFLESWRPEPAMARAMLGGEISW